MTSSASGNLDSAVEIRRFYTDSRYGQLHYLQGRPAGDLSADRPTLILLHQNPSSCLEYQHLLAEMAKDRRVVAFDTPGNGMSDGPFGPRPIRDFVMGFSDGLDRLGFGSGSPADVFGFHTGALLAADLAIARPDIVRRVVLSGIPFRNEEDRAERLAVLRRTPPATDDGKTILDRFAALWRYVVTRRDPGVPIERAAMMFMEKAKTMDRFWWPYEGVWTYAIADQFPKISQPALLLQPYEDLLEHSKAAARLIPNIEIVELPNLTRDVFEVGAREFAEELRRFLA